MVVRVSDLPHLNALGCVHQHECPLTGSKRPADLIAKVNMAWGVNQIQQVISAFVLINQGGRLCLQQRQASVLLAGRLQHAHQTVLVFAD